MRDFIGNLLRENLLEISFNGEPLDFSFSSGGENTMYYRFEVPNDKGNYNMFVSVSVRNSDDSGVIRMSNNLKIIDEPNNDLSKQTYKNVSIPTYKHGAYLYVSFSSNETNLDIINKGDIFKIMNTIKATVKDAIERVKKRGLALVMIYSYPIPNNKTEKDVDGVDRVKIQKNVRKKIYDKLYDDLVKTGKYKLFESGSHSGVYSIDRPRKPRASKQIEPKVANTAVNTASNTADNTADNITTNIDLSSLSYDDRVLAISRLVRPPVSARVNTTNQAIMQINKQINSNNTFIHTAMHEPNSTGHVSKIDAINDNGDEITLEFIYIPVIDFVSINGASTLVTLTNYYSNNEETSQFVKDHKDEFVNLIED